MPYLLSNDPPQVGAQTYMDGKMIKRKKPREGLFRNNWKVIKRSNFEELGVCLLAEKCLR
jgi:hypothetical protein